MKINIKDSGDVRVILAFKGENVKDAKELYDFLKEKEAFDGKSGEVYADLGFNGTNTVLLGLGEEKDLDHQELRLAFFNLGKELMKHKVKSAYVDLPKFEGLCSKKSVSSAVEGLLHSEYSWEKYLSEKKTKPSLEEFNINPVNIETDTVKDAIREAEILVDGIFTARDLVNERAMYLTPTALAKKAEEHLKPLGVEVEVYGREKIKELGMEAFLAVAHGSEEEPKFIVMRWLKGDSSDEKIGLVGKGLTYDSGGYSLKPSTAMDTMFCDMGGAGSVIGAMKAIAQAGLKKNVVAVVAACENMISGRAYKPGDIISSMAGKTIEVGNTDAEGRLTLADALYYISSVEKADVIVDVATLTGAVIVALADITTGAVSNNDELFERVKLASERAGEDIWRLPSGKEYRKLIDSDVADLSNTGKRGAGTVTAGLFLGEFVENKPWVHLDIAGTAYLSSARAYLPKGATGVPVATLYNFVKACNK